MKRYCLTQKGKEEIKKFFEQVYAWGLMILIAITILSMLLIFDTLPNYTAHVIVFILGISGWTILFSTIIISIKRWFQKNIVEC